MHRRVGVWLAVLALLASAVAPSISHAVARWRGGDAAAVLEICSPTGLKRISVAGQASGGDSSQPMPGDSMRHCGFCGVHAGSFALPAPPGLFIAMPLPLAVLPVEAAVAGWRLAPAYAHAQPRAPPLHA